MPHDGVVGTAFGLAIRGQLVDFAAGQRITGVDQAMRDAMDAAAADVTWDVKAQAAGVDLPPSADWEAFCATHLAPPAQAQEVPFDLQSGETVPADTRPSAEPLALPRRGRPPAVRRLDA